MARLAWIYSDDAGAIIENVYQFCMEEKKSGMKLSLNRIWDWTAALTGVTDLPLRKLWKSRRHMTSSNSQSNHRHLRRKCHWMTLTRAQTEYWLRRQQGSSSQRSPSYEVCLHTLWGESKSADGET